MSVRDTAGGWNDDGVAIMELGRSAPVRVRGVGTYARACVRGARGLFFLTAVSVRTWCY